MERGRHLLSLNSVQLTEMVISVAVVVAEVSGVESRVDPNLDR